MPVGLFEAAPYANDSIEMKPGDTMILYSDGVTEAHNVAGDEFGEERMVEVLKAYHKEPATVVLDKLIEAVKVFATGAEQYDDVTALVVQYTGPK
jgi:sigma-B regulation protein RsbU (phosphoserine phosphatase)